MTYQFGTMLKASAECGVGDPCEHCGHQPEAKTGIVGYIEGFYNTVRRRSMLGDLSPDEFKAGHHKLP